MRVKSVRIENFKQFASLRADFGELDCLVGANNSGKTTLLQALALFDFCVHHCLAKKNGHVPKNGGEQKPAHFELTNRTVAPEDFYVLPVTNPMDLWTNRTAMEGRKQKRIKVEVALSDGAVVTATVKLDFNRFGISIETSDTSQEALARLVELKISYLPVFSMFHPREERRMKPAIVLAQVFNREHGLAIKRWHELDTRIHRLQHRPTLPLFADHDRAGTAVTFRAAFLGAHAPGALANKFEHAHGRRNIVD